MEQKREKALILSSQLRTLHNQVDKVSVKETPSGITAFIPQYNQLLEMTKSLLIDNPAIYQTIIPLDPVNVNIQERLNVSYHRVAKSQILLGTSSLLSALESYVGPVVEVPSMKVTKEGIFFAGQYFDAIRTASEIFSLAQKSIVIIDGYINEVTLSLLTNKREDVQVRILTKSVPDFLKTFASSFNKQHGGLSIRTSEAFHDRFIIIDDEDCYHFGASIKDLGHRGFMFSRIEEPTVVEMLKRQFEEEWAKAKAEVVPPD